MSLMFQPETQPLAAIQGVCATWTGASVTGMTLTLLSASGLKSFSASPVSTGAATAGHAASSTRIARASGNALGRTITRLLARIGPSLRAGAPEATGAALGIVRPAAGRTHARPPAAPGRALEGPGPSWGRPRHGAGPRVDRERTMAR